MIRAYTSAWVQKKVRTSKSAGLERQDKFKDVAVDQVIVIKEGAGLISGQGWPRP